jgi:type I restriction enzyme R subunit
MCSRAPDNSNRSDLGVFDPGADYAVIERQLPHWTQPGVIAFITWRTNDSIPADVLKRWRAERHEWLYRHGIDGDASDWRDRLRILSKAIQSEYERAFADRWHDLLDAGHGACVLRRPEIGKIVSDSLHHFDGDRYDLTDFVVMPNHVHVLAAFRHAEGMMEQCESWKHFQSTQINRSVGAKGRFWQRESFDHLVRSVEQFEHLRRYIAQNGPSARLPKSDYIHYSKPLHGSSN